MTNGEVERPQGKETSFVRDLIAGAIVWMVVASAAIISTMLSFRLLFKWVIYLNAKYNPWYLAYALVADLLSFLEPPELEVKPEPEPEPEIFWLKWMDGLVPMLLGSDLILVSIVVVAACIGFMLCQRIVGNRLRKAVFMMRGIHCESMRAGSVFFKGDIPRYQVAVRRPGIFGEQHIGYGVRIGQFMATPKHVILDVGSEMLLVGSKGKVLVSNPVPIHSRIVNDLVYLHLSDRVWTQAGVSTASLSKDISSASAACTGLEGCSTGMLRKSQMVGQVLYDGSTIPGMSGAGYDMAGACLGIHIGSLSGTQNMGVSASVMRAELRQIIKPESRTGGHSSSPLMAALSAEKSPLKLKGGKTWASDIIDKMANVNWNLDSWNPDEEIDYNAILDFGEESAKPKPVFAFPAESAILVNNQGTEETVSEYQMLSTQVVSQVEANTRTIGNLANKVSQLEQAVAMMQVNKPKGKYPCSHCDLVCVSEERLANHVAESHLKKKVRELVQCRLCGNLLQKANLEVHENSKCANRVQKESALPTDFVSDVKQAPFLGQRSNSPKRNYKTSPKSSTLKGKKDQFQLLQESLSAMLESQKDIANLLKTLQPAMAGQNSAARQS